MRKLLFILFIFSSPQIFAALKSSEVMIEAQSAFQRGDLLNAYRYYTLAVEKTPDAVDAKDIENIVIAEYIIMNQSDFIKACRDNTSHGPLKVEFSFYCTKTLIHNEKYVEATDFSEEIPKSYQRLEYDLMKSSLYLSLNKPGQCLEQLAIANKKITPSTSLHFQDLIKVVQARCFLMQSRYDQAIGQFQSLSVSSDFYLTTLEEQAWTQFKARNLAASRDVLKIIISYFTSQNQKDQIFGADLYFRTKYLQAYIELISQNREKARDMFTELRLEIQSFKKTYFAKMTLPKDIEAKISQLKSTSQLLTKDYTFIAQFRGFIDNWTPTDDLKQFDNHLRAVVALNQELQTLSLLSNPELRSYQERVKKLKSIEISWIGQAMKKYFSDSKHAIDSIEFKTNMGQVENFWADRTEGKRTLADVLEAYKNEVNYVEDRIEK